MGASNSLCPDVADRSPRLVGARTVQQLLASAPVAQHVFDLCHDNFTSCNIIPLESPFSAAAPAPTAQGLTLIDQRAVKRQFWWQWHVEAAPQAFGWTGDPKRQPRAHNASTLKKLRALAGLYHTYAVGVGRVLSNTGAVVELCKRCAWEGALYVPPDSKSRSGVRHLVDWAAPPPIISEPASRPKPSAITRGELSAFYAHATRKPLWSYAKLLVLVQRFSSDYGHFLTELLPRMVLALPALRADRELAVLADCSAPFVVPWMHLLADLGPGRLVCKPPAASLIHADCLAFARFTSPFPSGFRLGLAGVRSAAYAAVGLANEGKANAFMGWASAMVSTTGMAAKINTMPSHRLIIWVDRDLSPGSATVHRTRDVPRSGEIASALGTALPDHRIVFFRGSRFSPNETVRLFSQADAVVGPSGSGLHNILFARPGTLVVEILPSDMSYANIWQDAALLGLRYRAMHVHGFTVSTNAMFTTPDIKRLVKGVAREIRHAVDAQAKAEAPRRRKRPRASGEVNGAMATKTINDSGFAGARGDELDGRRLHALKWVADRAAISVGSARSRSGHCHNPSALPAGCATDRFLGFQMHFGLSNRCATTGSASRFLPIIARGVAYLTACPREAACPMPLLPAYVHGLSPSDSVHAHGMTASRAGSWSCKLQCGWQSSPIALYCCRRCCLA